jgi:CMP-N,N'-diacetyllegionaminic acid synthase
MSNRNILVIPARGGSQGISEKNLQTVGGDPLVIRSLKHAIKMGSDYSVVLSTDNQAILNRITDFLRIKRFDLSGRQTDTLHDLGPIHLHFRSQEFADSNAIIGIALKSLRLIYLESSVQFDCWVLLQPTTPFRSSKELHQLASAIKEDFGPHDSWVSVKKVEDSHPGRMYELFDGTGNLSSLPGYEKFKAVRRQDLPTVYLRDGAFYCISDELVAEGKQFSENPRPIIRKGPWTINIDDEMDLEMARIYAEVLSE